MKIFHNILLIFFLSLCLISSPRWSAASDEDLTGFTLESLMEMKVSSVSKKKQTITSAAAAVFVITQEDIRRSGATTIADALRMAPGIQVARIDSNKWAVSSRGFNGRFSNKLLVLMDGRNLYTPYFMGVYWEIQDTLLEDIDRIEVVRGPGASLWGENAVNGVINIITKSADATNGVLISGGGGTYEKAFAAARVGTPVSDTGSLRLYAKHQQRDSFLFESGASANDQWHTSRGGFRIDNKPDSRNSLTIQGDYYDGRLDETYLIYDHPSVSSPPYTREVHTSTPVSGGNILTRWHRTISETSDLSLQLYYDHSENGMHVSPQVFNTYDIDFMHRFSPGQSHDLTWGIGYRHNRYNLITTQTLDFTAPNVTNQIFSSYIHDEITLIPSSLSLILGSRFEHNDYSDFSVQPNARLLWSVTPRSSLWGSVSRAVRSATKSEQDVNYNYRTLAANTFPGQSVPLRLEINGSDSFKSEELVAYELGFRSEVAPRLMFDLALYYNDYRNLRVITPGDPYQEPASGSPANMVQPYALSNDMHGRSVGIEIAAEWSPCDWWRVQTAYSYQNIRMQLEGTSKDDTNKGNAEGDTPQHQASLRSAFDISRSLSLDLWLRGTDRLASIDNVAIPGFITLDARIGWKPVTSLELSLVGQNLFQSRHPEFIPEYINTLPSEIPRSIYGKAVWKF